MIKFLFLIVVSYILGMATTFVIFPIIGMVIVLNTLEFLLLSVTFAVFYFFIGLLILDKFY